MEKSPQKHNHRRAGHGVTLIELLVVIVIMAVIMSIAIPAFNNLGRGTAMRGAVASVKSTLSLARQWAITKREETVFVYGNMLTSATPCGCYAVYTEEMPDSTNIVYLQSTNFLDLPLTFKDIDVGHTNVIVFKTDGSLAGGGVNYTNIVITDPNQGIMRTINIHRLTGNIVVE